MAMVGYYRSTTQTSSSKARFAMASASDVTMTSRHGVWRDMLRDHFVTLDVDAGSGDQFTGAVRSTSLGHLQVSSVRSVTQEVMRTDALLQRDGKRYLQVGLVRSGEAHVVQDGRACLLRPGDFVLYETERPFSWGLRAAPQLPQWELSVFTWPRETVRLAEHESPEVTCRVLDGTSGITGVLSRMLADLLVTSPTVSHANAARLADEVGDLVATVAAEVSGLGGGSDLRDGLLRQIDAYIDQNLDNPCLSPTLVAQAHFISTRQLQRLFARRGSTVAQVIRQRRLERCRRDLLARRDGELTLTEICLRWGFSELAVFSRAFREVYGMSPSEYRAHARS
ncbi:helix-turn-helix domain-containing protein [Streptomyces flaveus]|uniref:helix-turn-helix domain-containing protein n=1 Tax=Streptomyces flaveus TaxID=66370 RepID=UPI003329E0A7